MHTEGMDLGQKLLQRAITVPKRQLQCSVPNRHTLLQRFLKKHNSIAEQKKRKDKELSHKQDTKEMRIQHITAKRFNLREGRMFPPEAIEAMAQRGVRRAIQTQHDLQRLEEFNARTKLMEDISNGRETNYISSKDISQCLPRNK